MTTLRQLVALLDGIGLDSTQIQWAPDSAPPLPYAVIVPQGTENRFADGMVYAGVTPYLVELYTRERDVPLEKRLQKAFDDGGIGWQRYHTTDPDGPVVIAVYTVTVTED